MAATPAPDTAHAPRPDSVRFEFPDPGHELAAVRLWQEVGVPRDLLGFRYEKGTWSLLVDAPPVDRMEYLFELHHRDGSRETVLDPANALHVGGAFGPHSVLELPGYHHPRWLSVPVPAGDYVAGSERGVSWRVWSPAGVRARDAVPLVVAHDGPEYDELALLTRCIAASVADGTMPAARCALLEPGNRDDEYSANPAYTRVLTRGVLPSIRLKFPTTTVVGLGASLGALAMLYASRRDPPSLDAMLLQSGSFFRSDLDAQERGFRRFRRIERFVGEVLGEQHSARPIPVVVTCGTAEENLANNRLMAEALRRQGHPVRMLEVRDAHNYTAWRDALQPPIAELVRAVA